MRGQLLPVWPQTWIHIWLPLNESEEAPEELFSELYREFSAMPRRPKEPPQATEFADDGGLSLSADIAARDAYRIALDQFAKDRAAHEEALDSSGVAQMRFQVLLNTQVTDEASAMSFLDRAFVVIESFENNKLRAEYVALVRSFIDTFNLRYDLRASFVLSATLSGLFASLWSEFRGITTNDPHLRNMFEEFEDAMSDSTREPTAGRIKSCLQKQFNLTEALGQRHPGVNADTLGGICNQITSWPHATVKEALKKIYGLRSDFPGISHGGNPEAAQRELDMRDQLAISVLLIGFVPYLMHDLDMSAFTGAK
jgi:hypothetical protein